MSGMFAVIATWNGESWVDKCLESLRRSTIPVEIVVVDNASTDSTVRLIREEFAEATCMRLIANLGFGRANNIGIRFAYGQGATHVFLLNQDATVEPMCVEILLRTQLEQPRYGILSPVHLNGDGTRLDQLFAEHICKNGGRDGLFSDLFLGCELRSVYSMPFVNAAAWLVSRQCIETVGLFNPVFRHYGEDMEYASRVRHIGLRVGVAPAALVFHAREGRGDAPIGLTKRLALDRAMLRYRLARFDASTSLNIVSALSYAVLADRGRATGLRRWAQSLALLRTVCCELPEILRRRRRATRPGPSFFEDAAADQQRYVAVAQAGAGE
jgi:GT2 family glycosyltransferase